MGKISPLKLTEAQERKLKEDLFYDFQNLNSEGFLLEVLKHILTPSEIVMLARRMVVAKLLMQGLSFPAIQEKLGVGQNTVVAVDRWLSEFRDYRIAMPRMLEASRKKRPPPAPYSFRWVRKKYPMHFLLFNLLLGDPYK